MFKNPLVMIAIAVALMIVTLAFGLYPANAQEREHPGLTIVAPTDGATVGGPVTVAYGLAGVEAGSSQRHHGHRRALQVVLLVDQVAPEPGSTFVADQTHIFFPDGQVQATVILPTGPHSLQLAVLDHEGKVGRRPATSPVSIVVQ